MEPPDLKVIHVDQQDSRLGRFVVHDERSRRFSAVTVIDQTEWRTKAIRLFDPTRNPEQVVGNCTGCDKAMELNAVGNRQLGRILDMEDADKLYSLATRLDPFPGSWPPEDTGSYGLAACKAANMLGLGGEYRHIFSGADGVVQSIMDGRTVGVGTWWYAGMFDRKWNSKLRRWDIEPTGSRQGGHQYRATAYHEPSDSIRVRCWWGSYRDVWIKRSHLDDLLMDDGDAHVQASV